MEKIVLEIIEKEGINNEFLSEYWKFVDEKKFKFTFKGKSLIEKYKLENNRDLSEMVAEAGSLLVKILKDCNKCYADFYISNRANFNNFKIQVLHHDIVCHECKNIRINKRVKKLISEIEEHECEVNNENFEIKELNYLEKIYLHLLIENYKKSLFVDEWRASNVLINSGNNTLVRRIIQKGYIKDVKGCPSCYINKTFLYSQFVENKNEFSEELKSKIELILKNNYNYYSEIIVPEKFNNIDHFMVELYSDIINNSNLTIDEVRELEEIIFNQRFSDVYRLIALVCKENAITCKKDSALEYEVSRMIKKYNLEVIYFSLNYCAMRTTSKLYVAEKLSESNLNYDNPNLYRDLLSRRIDYLDGLIRSENCEKDKLYSRSLPYGWVDSEIEVFINTYIVDGFQRWSKFTPNEILKIILEKKNVNF